MTRGAQDRVVSESGASAAAEADPSGEHPEQVQARLRGRTDVAAVREAHRRRRLWRIAVLLAPFAAWLWMRLLSGHPVRWGLPQWPDVDPIYPMTGFFFIGMLAIMGASMMVAGRSPHVTYRPEQIDVRMDHVKGLDPVKEDVERSLDLFLTSRTFRQRMGGTARRGILFEGPPGTGKTYMAKAMAAEAGVPFLFVSATSFQSMWYGATARQIRGYFKALRKAARAEGGAIGFIEEIDAIGLARGMSRMTPAPAAMTASAAGTDCGGLAGLATSPSGFGPSGFAPSGFSMGALAADGSAGTWGSVVNRMGSSDVGGVVNELLVQMQSFDALTRGQRVHSWAVDRVNKLLPEQRRLPRPRPQPCNVLIIAATNRADSLDPALLRPGRFDRRMAFDLPDKAGRRAIVDHFLARKAHETELDDVERRDALAGITQGFSPVMIENLLDEALVNAVRRGASAMSWKDIEHARLVTQIGVGQPVGYTEHEQRLIATHEAGHAVTAWLEAPERRLEILTIIKRAGALGLLAHGDRDDVYTRSRTELRSLIRIAFGGQVAEELFFGDVSTGPGSDLLAATKTAAQMVGQAGMEGTLISFAAVEGSMLNGGNLVSRVLGDSEGRRMVEELLQEQKAHVRVLLRENRHLVEALRDALVERHELIGHEITDVLENAHEVYQAGRAVQSPPATASPGTIDLRSARPAAPVTDA